MKKYEELDSLILSVIQRGLRPHHDEYALKLARDSGHDLNLIDARLQSLRKAGKIYYNGLQWRTGVPASEAKLDGLERECAAMRVLCTTFAKELVHAIDVIGYLCMGGKVLLFDGQQVRLAKARAEAETFLTGGSK
jgi:hypothetical protein